MKSRSKASDTDVHGCRSYYTRSAFIGARVETKPVAFHKTNVCALVMITHTSLIRSQLHESGSPQSMCQAQSTLEAARSLEITRLKTFAVGF